MRRLIFFSILIYAQKQKAMVNYTEERLYVELSWVFSGLDCIIILSSMFSLLVASQCPFCLRSLIMIYIRSTDFLKEKCAWRRPRVLTSRFCLWFQLLSCFLKVKQHVRHFISKSDNMEIHFKLNNALLLKNLTFFIIVSFLHVSTPLNKAFVDVPDTNNFSVIALVWLF